MRAERSPSQCLERRYEDGLPDGGMRFEVVVDGEYLTMEASRVAVEGQELPPVIREKQLTKKMLARLEANGVTCDASFRPVGSGSF